MKESCPAVLPAMEDPPLTKIGRNDARALKEAAANTCPELLIMSPMRRATQTILIGFVEHISRNKIPAVANEDCREQLCCNLSDKRSSVSDLAAEYPQVNYDLLQSDEDIQWSPSRRESMLDMSHRCASFLQWLGSRPEREVVVGSHSAWLLAVFTVVVDVAPGQEGALHPVFKTGEMRSVVLEWS